MSKRRKGGRTKVAIAGAGAGGALHASAVSATSQAKTTVIAATVPANAEFLSSQVGAEPISVTELPAGADVAVVATTPESHYEVAFPLIGEGIPTLVEKPLAATLAEADALIRTAEAGGSLLCYAENVLFAPVVDATLQRRQILDKITNLEVRFYEPAPENPHMGAIGSSAHSAIALGLLLAGGELEALRCKATSTRADGLEEAARIELRFSNEVIAVVDVGWSGEGVQWSSQIATEEMVLATRLFPDTVLEANGNPVDIGQSDSGEESQRLKDLGFVDQMAGFLAASEGKGGRVCPAGFGLAVLEVIYAAYESASNDGEEVTFPYRGDRTSAPNSIFQS